jgi:hypothetical protein
VTGTAPSIQDSRKARFVRRLAHAHYSSSAGLAAARLWKPGKVDRRVVALTCLDWQPATAGEYTWWAQTAKLFGLWHCGRPDVAYGSSGHGIGRWAHQLGVGNAAAEHLMARIASATTAAALDDALTVLAGRRTPRPPHWETVITELATWADAGTRDQVRFAWLRDFYRFPPRNQRYNRSSKPVTQPLDQGSIVD